MNYPDLLRQIKMYVARVAGTAETGHQTALGKNDQIKGRGDGKTTDQCRRIFAYGLRSLPTEGSEGVVLVINGGRRSGGSAVLIAAENTGQGPQDLEGGEVCLYSEHGQVIRFAKDGSIKIDAAPGKDVVVNGGTAKVARVGDTCKLTAGGQIEQWMALVEAFVNGVAPGTIANLVAVFAAAPGIEISAGAGNFKG